MHDSLDLTWLTCRKCKEILLLCLLWQVQQAYYWGDTDLLFFPPCSSLIYRAFSCSLKDKPALNVPKTKLVWNSKPPHEGRREPTNGPVDYKPNTQMYLTFALKAGKCLSLCISSCDMWRFEERNAKFWCVSTCHKEKNAWRNANYHAQIPLKTASPASYFLSHTSHITYMNTPH